MCLLLFQLLITTYSHHLTFGRRESRRHESRLVTRWFNDEPYSNRALVCCQQRRRFEVESVNTAL